MKPLLLSSAAFLTAGAVHAGGPTQPAPDPEPMEPAVVMPTPVSDWTGPYAGLSFGGTDAEIGGNSERAAVYGLFGGYDHDFGDFVLGGEIDFQGADDLTVSGVDVDNLTRLKLRAGVDLGDTLVYATAGGARIGTSDGDGTGFVGGVGAEYRLTDRFSVGGEFLSHSFDDVGNANSDIDVNTVSLRGTMRF